MNLIVFGAGASYQSIPTIFYMKRHLPILVQKLSEFKKAKIAALMVERKLNSSDTEIQTQNVKSLNNEFYQLNQFIDDIKEISDSLAIANTPDTKLRVEFDNNRRKFSRLLKSYWIYLNLIQFANREEIGLDEKNLKKDFAFNDSRYTQMIMDHYKNNEDKYLFYSWNYDLQFEYAYKFAYGLSELEDVFHETPVTPRPSGVNSTISDPKFLHLNGISGFYESRDQYDSVLTGRYSEIETNMNLGELLDQLLWLYKYPPTPETTIESMLRFSFTLLPLEQSKIEQLMDKQLKEITKTVYIGYSFPVCNREIDQLILNRLPKDSKIVLQNPIGYKHELVEHFNIDASRITEITALDRMQVFEIE